MSGNKGVTLGMSVGQRECCARGGRWVATYQPRPGAWLKLFCFSYAGAGASTFRSWPDAFPPQIEICAVQLPGRETRIRERPFDRIDPLVWALVPALTEHFDRPFAFFGHSMGALIAFELVRELLRRGLSVPVHLFVSGRGAPHLRPAHADLHRLPDDEFVRALRLLNGTPVKVFEHPELLQMLLPALRADFSVCGTYVYREAPPLPCAITACGGVDDPDVPPPALERWRSFTADRFEMRMFPGDHFYLRTSEPALLAALGNGLAPHLGTEAASPCSS